MYKTTETCVHVFQALEDEQFIDLHRMWRSEEPAGRHKTWVTEYHFSDPDLLPEMLTYLVKHNIQHGYSMEHVWEAA